MNKANQSSIDFTSVTEAPGVLITREARHMLHTRYGYAGKWCAGKDVLEVASGAGVGLGYLSRHARRVVGSDFTESLLQEARKHYGRRIDLVRLDAHLLPFTSQSFDVILLFEALYFLENPEAFLQECRRVLRPHGELYIFVANPARPSFNRSSMSYHYYNSVELITLLSSRGFRAQVYGLFPDDLSSVRARVLNGARNLAVRLRLLPRTMKGKEFLKRLFIGNLTPVEREIVDLCDAPATLHPISTAGHASRFKVLCATAISE